ncbi:hypothetical protein DVH05_014422 [Phytophthora capsici]|nr:hypothetical protein DVH05_014422 [Phytophthora capsici]
MELQVRAVSARNLIDVQTFGKQDPYCKLSLRSKSFRTKVHDNGDKTPEWNEVFILPVVDPQLDQLVIEVKNKNFTNSKLIGECRLPVSLFLDGNIEDQWYALTNDSKSAGEINLRVQYRGPPKQPEPEVPVAYTEKTYEKQHSYSSQPPSYPPPAHAASEVYSPPKKQESHEYPSAAPAYPEKSSGYPAPQQYPPPGAAPPAQGYPPQQHYQQPPQQQPYYQQPPPHYGQGQAPPQYGQPYQQPPPQGYGYPPQQHGYAAGPLVMVVEGHHHHRGYGSPDHSPRRYGGGYGGGGYGGRSEGGGMSGAQMAMGVGAGVVGGLVLGEVLDDVFDDE